MRSQLTGRDYSMSENFSRGTEFNRQKLYPMFKKAKHMNNYKRVFLNDDNLVIDDVRYNVDTIDTRGGFTMRQMRQAPRAPTT